MVEIIKIAIAEDQSIIRLALTEQFSRIPNMNVVLEAGNGKVLLEKFQYFYTDIDVLLLDIEMPVLNGYDTLKELRKFYPELRVIIYSGKSDLKVIEQFMSLGANDFVCKTCDFKNLIEAINKEYKLLKENTHRYDYYLNEGQINKDRLCHCLNK